jgi:hypothetical protein
LAAFGGLCLAPEPATNRIKPVLCYRERKLLNHHRAMGLSEYAQQIGFHFVLGMMNDNNAQTYDVKLYFFWQLQFS